MRFLRAVGAAVVLVALIVGAPVALWVFARELLPDRLPSSAQGWVDALFSRDDGTLFLTALLLVGVVLWLVFTVSALTEIAAAVAGRPGQWRVVGLGWAQRLMRGLVAAVIAGTTATLVAGPVAAASPAPLTAAVTMTPTTSHDHDVSPAGSVQRSQAAHRGAPAAHRSTTDSSAAVVPGRVARHAVAGAASAKPVTERSRAERTWTVARYDTLWSIAEKALGDPTLYPRIVELNRGLVQSDGKVLRNADTPLEIGWVLRLPPAASAAIRGGASRSVTVEPGDTLSQIALDQLGDAALATDLARVNHIADPDVIEVGQTINLSPLTQPRPAHPPASAAPAAPPERDAPPKDERSPDDNHRPKPAVAAPSPATPSRSAPSTAGPASRPTVAAPTADPSPGLVQGDAEPVTPDRAAPAITAAPTPTTGSVSRAPAASTPAVYSPDSSAGTTPSARVSDVVFLASGGGALLAALMLAAVAVRRRRQARHRRPGRAAAPPQPDLVPLEQALMVFAAVDDAQWLDEALRGLAHAPGQAPPVVAVRQSATELVLHLAEPWPSPPSSWTCDESGRRWTLRRGEDTGYRPEERQHRYGPYPMLVSIGHTAAERWLVDLEQLASVTVVGDPARAMDLARFMAAELAHNSWSELLEVTLCGFGEELVGAGGDRLRFVADPREVLRELTEQASRVPDSDDAVLAIRAGDGSVEPWPVRVLLISGEVAAADPEAVAGVLRATSDRSSRSAVALVVAGATQDWDAGVGGLLELAGDGRLHASFMGVSMVAEQLPVSEAGDLSRLLTLAAATEDMPGRPAGGEQPWDELADAAGTLTVCQGRPDLDRPVRLAEDVGEFAGSSVLPRPTHAYVRSGATTAEDVARLAPQVSTPLAERVATLDERLDADLAAWSDPTCVRPKVALLGPPTVRAQGSLPVVKPRLAWHTEVVALLASRPRGMTTSQFGTAMWPDEPGIEGKTKLRQALSVARQWLGVNPETGTQFIPANPGVASLYRLEGALIDADLFRRLRIRGVARGAEGITDLEAALELVDGPPFDQIRPRRYAWLAETPLHNELTAMIVDVAHTVACHHLAEDDPGRAAAAAQVALRAGCLDDTPRLDLVKACLRQGREREARHWVDEIVSNHDEAEVPEDLPPRTYEILIREGWGDLAG